MNVGQVRPPDVTNKPVLIQRPGKDVGRPSVLSGADEAQLSDAARQSVREAESYATRLRAPDIEHQRLIEGARGKLQRGELDDLRVLRETAQRLIDQHEAS